MYQYFVYIACLIVCFRFFVPLENFSLIWKRHHYRWWTTNFDLYLPLMAIENWWLFMYHTCCDTGQPFFIVISDDPWHSRLLPSVWQWSCHYLLKRLRCVPTGDWNLISFMRGERSTITPPRFIVLFKLVVSTRKSHLIINKTPKKEYYIKYTYLKRSTDVDFQTFCDCLFQRI